MIQYKKEEFFSARGDGVKPEFLIEIQYVTIEISDTEKISEVISNNLIIIQSNINEKTKNKNRKNRRDTGRYDGGKVSVKPKKFVKTRGEATTKIHVKLNQLSRETFNKTTRECIELLEDYDKTLIKTELCYIIYERIVDGYDYLDMYSEFIKRLYMKLDYGKLLISSLTDSMIERTRIIIEMNTESEKDKESQVLEKKKCMGFLLFSVILYNQNVIEEDSYRMFIKTIVERDFLYNIIYERIIYEYEYIEVYIKLIIKMRVSEGDKIERLMDMFYEKFEKSIRKFNGLTEEECSEEDNVSEKKKNIKVVLFIGHLYNKDIVDYKYLSKFLDILKKSDNIVYIELLCKMIYISHIKLNFKVMSLGLTVRDMLADIIKKRQQDVEKNTRIYYEMQNVIELQRKKWRNADLKKLIDNSLKGTIKGTKEKEKVLGPKVSETVSSFGEKNTSTVKISTVKISTVKISIDDLKVRYNNNTLDVNMSYSLTEENLQELLDELLDECIDQDGVQIKKLSKYCESIKDRRDTVLKSIKTMESNIDELRMDIPDIETRIKSFKESF
jgi:hypothetical protein